MGASSFIARHGLILKGNLDVGGNTITTSIANGNITIQANGTGKVQVGSLKFPTNIGSSNQCLVTDASGNLTWANVGFYDLTTFTTDDLAEGLSSNRKYYSNTLFNASLATKTTDDLTQGNSNKYYATSLFDTDFSAKTTTHLAEGDNKYWTDTRFNDALALKTSDDIAQGTTNKYYNDTLFTDSFANASIGGLSDVTIDTASHDAGLIYDSSASQWVNKQLGSAAFATIGTSAGNVVVLAGNAKLPPEVMPALAINDIHIVATITDRDNLVTTPGVQIGDMAKVTDEGRTYVYDGTNWVEIVTHYAVDSVNGQTGVVVLNASNIDVSATPSNYTSGGTTIENHFSGVDTKLGLKLENITNEPLADLSDVEITNPLSANLLMFNGTSWINAPTVGETNVIYVSTSGFLIANGGNGSIHYPYSSIQQAIDSGVGDVIRIAPGTYTENITLSSSKAIKLIGPSSALNQPSVVINGKFVIQTGSVYASNIEFKNTSVTSTDYAVDIQGCTLGRHEFHNVVMNKGVGNELLTALNITGLSTAYLDNRINVLMSQVSIYGNINHEAGTQVTIHRNVSTSTRVSLNAAVGRLNILNWQQSNKITHVAGYLYIDGIQKIVHDGTINKICIESSATSSANDFLWLDNISTLQGNGEHGVINKTGSCEWFVGSVTRNLGNDSFIGTSLGKYKLNSLDIDSNIDLNTDISNYSPAFGKPDVYSHLRGIDTALGSLNSNTVPASIFDAAGDLIVGTGNNTFGRLGKGSNGQFLSVVGGVVTWDNVPAGFQDPLTSKGDLMYRNTDSTNGTTTRLPIGTTNQLLTVINNSTGQIGWADKPVLKDETSPTLGANLNVFDGTTSHQITTTQVDGNIVIAPNGIGKIVLDNHSWPNSLGTGGQALFTDASGNLYFDDVPATGVTSVNGKTGSSITLVAADITSGYSPTKYTVSGSTIDDHFTGINSKLGNIAGADVVVGYSPATSWTPTTSSLDDNLSALDSSIATINSRSLNNSSRLDDIEILTTAGDLIYSSDNTGTFARLPIDTNGKVLTIVNGFPAWSDATGGIADVTSADGDLIVRSGGAIVALPAGISNNDKALVVVAGIPTYTAIPLQVNGSTGNITLNGANLTSTNTPTNYTNGTTSIDSHLSGIDSSIGTQKTRIDNIVAVLPRFTKEVFTLTATNITNGYVDLTKTMLDNSSLVIVSGLVHLEIDDYTVSHTGGVSRVTFAGDLAANLVEGSKVVVQYAFVQPE